VSGEASIVRVSDDRTLPTEFHGKIEPNYYCRGWSAKRKKYCGARAGTGTAHPGLGRCTMHGGQKRDGDKRMRGGGRSAIPATRVKELVEQHLADKHLFDVSRTLATAKALMDEYIERHAELTPALLAWYGQGEPITEPQRLALLRCIEELEALYGEGEPTAQQSADLAEARAAVARLAEPRIEKPRRVPDLSEAVNHADVISKIIHRVNQHQSQTAISYQRLASFMFELRRQLDALVPDRAQLQRINDTILTIRV
jgi:hypothetical protein